MDILSIIILNCILVLFPILLYLLFMAYTKNIEIDEKNIFLSVALIMSLYLITEYGHGIIISKPVLIVDVPLLICYLKKSDKLAVFFSLVLVIYKTSLYDIAAPLVISNYLLTYIIFVIHKDKPFIFEIQFVILKIIYFTIFFHISKMSLINYLCTSLSFVTTCNLVLFIIECAEKIMTLFMDVKELEHEKQIKMSLFKISHEIKNPIAVCKGYIEIMGNSTTKCKKYIPIVKEELDHTLLILQDFSSIGKTKITLEVMDVNFLLNDLIINMKQMIVSKKIKLVYKYNQQEVLINGDYMRLKQVFINIIKNAMEALEEISNPKIIINYYIENKKVYINFIDNGIGIDDEDMCKIKQAFFTTKSKGTGLGVYLSNDIIESHKGKLNYYKLNKGTRVEIILNTIKQDK